MAKNPGTRQALSVDSPHPVYPAHIEAVKKMRAFIEGKEKVKQYILGLPGQVIGSKDEKMYKKRAYYLPAIGRTIDAFVGMVMSNGAKVTELPEAYKMYTDDITNDGEPFSRFTSNVVREIISTARGAVLADYPDRPDAEVMTRKAAEDLGLRPYARFYPTEDIFNWQVRTVDGQRILSQLRLYEDFEEPGVSEWDRVTGRQIRVLDLEPGTGFYRVRIFRKPVTTSGVAGGEWLLLGQPRYPMMNGKKLTYIPAIVFGPSSLDPSIIDKSPLDEMADIAESHLNNSADAEWGLMFCGCPTVIIAGSVPEDSAGKPLPIRIGGADAIILGEGGTADLLQATGEAIGAIEKRMEAKEKHMAAVGARILIDSGSSNISTETAKLERVGEHSVLSDIALVVGSGMAEILQMVLQWGGMSEDLALKVGVTLNTDYTPKGMTVGELSEWVKAVQSGKVPLKILFAKLQARGEIPDEMTEEEYRDELKADADELGLNDPLADDPEGDPAKKPATVDPEKQAA